MTTRRVAFREFGYPASSLIGGMNGTQNPHVMARLHAHRFGIPWQFVKQIAMSNEFALLNVLECVRFEDLGDLSTHCLCLAEVSFGLCQSPIEELFLAHCVGLAEDFFLWTDHEEDASGVWKNSDIIIRQQAQVAGCRVDFAFVRPNGMPIAIELDGHDFHERTKQQATRDKSRDRAIQAEGWPVLRFTGSEVWKDPAKCVAEAYKMACGAT